MKLWLLQCEGSFWVVGLFANHGLDPSSLICLGELTSEQAMAKLAAIADSMNVAVSLEGVNRLIDACVHD